MWTSIKECYRESARFARAWPLLFALPLAAELAQHVVEYRIGMFASVEAMIALEGDSSRMTFGVVKVVTLLVYTYWVNRWLAYGRDGRRRVLGDGRSAFLFAWVVALGLVTGGLQLFGGALLRPFGASEGIVLAVGLVFVSLTIVLDIYITAWKVGAALGNGRLTIPVSFRIMRGNFWWSIGFYIAMILPLMIAHQLIGGIAPLGRPDAILWPILIFDSLLVAYLGTVLAATGYLIARRAAERKGASLT